MNEFTERIIKELITKIHNKALFTTESNVTRNCSKNFIIKDPYKLLNDNCELIISSKSHENTDSSTMLFNEKVIITEKDALKLSNNSEIIITADSIITPLAIDVIKANKIKITRK